jgi:hypothetical protein
MGDSGGACRVLVRRSEGRRLLGRPRSSWEDNINTVLREVGRGGMDWVDVAENWDWLGALVNAVISLWVS